MITPLSTDEYTIALYHFDEGRGNEALCATGDRSVTLRARHAVWGERPGGGAVARFSRREDDANVFVGPVDHDKLHLRSCTNAWTVEAWVRVIGFGGRENSSTYVCICGNDDEGFALRGVRGGWIFPLRSADDRNRPQGGLAPGARFMGALRGRDPNHDTSGSLMPSNPSWRNARRECFIRDSEWHHIAWQFRYADQTHFFFIDHQLVNAIQLPLASSPLREVINDSERVGVPFTVGGFVHSQDPPFHLGRGNLDGEIAELRISSVLRYPVAERLSIVKQRGRVADELNMVAGAGLPFRAEFTADAADGNVTWEIAEGKLPEGLALDSAHGIVSGLAHAAAGPREVVLKATDEAGCTDWHCVSIVVRPGRITTVSIPPAFSGSAYDALLGAENLAEPLRWELAGGDLPDGLSLNPSTGAVFGTPTTNASRTRDTFCVCVTDAAGTTVKKNLEVNVVPASLANISPDEHVVFLYDWQGSKARLIHDVIGDDELALDWTNMGGDRRVEWPGRNGRFPQDTGHGEHGFVSLATNHDKHNLRTCRDEWTVEAWARRGGSIQAYGRDVSDHHRRFDFGHICGTYDTDKRGVWELYLSDHGSPDGAMAPGVHFFGSEPEQALENLHPWTRPEGIVGDVRGAGIRDIEWHHVAWQYSAAEDLHQLFLDGRLIWQMQSPDGRRLVNNRRHDAQFSVSSRINGYVVRGRDENGERGDFNWLGWGNFFGQIGEIRVSDIRRYEST